MVRIRRSVFHCQRRSKRLASFVQAAASKYDNRMGAAILTYICYDMHENNYLNIRSNMTNCADW